MGKEAIIHASGHLRAPSKLLHKHPIGNNAMKLAPGGHSISQHVQMDLLREKHIWHISNVIWAWPQIRLALYHVMWLPGGEGADVGEASTDTTCAGKPFSFGSRGQRIKTLIVAQNMGNKARVVQPCMRTYLPPTHPHIQRPSSIPKQG